MTAEVGRYLFVRLEPGLHHSRHSGVFLAIKSLPGVELVTDLSVVSPELLCDVLLMTPEPTTRRRNGGAKNVQRDLDDLLRAEDQ